MKCQYSCICLF